MARRGGTSVQTTLTSPRAAADDDGGAESTLGEVSRPPHERAEPAETWQEFPEGLLAESIALFEMEPRRAYDLEHEQIDGSLSFDTSDYIVERRWRERPVSREDADIVAAKVRRKARTRLVCSSASVVSLRTRLTTIRFGSTKPIPERRTRDASFGRGSELAWLRAARPHQRTFVRMSRVRRPTITREPVGRDPLTNPERLFATNGGDEIATTDEPPSVCMTQAATWKGIAHAVATHTQCSSMRHSWQKCRTTRQPMSLRVKRSMRLHPLEGSRGPQPTSVGHVNQAGISNLRAPSSSKRTRRSTAG